MLAALALGATAAACGDASSCPSLDGVRARMREAPPFAPSRLTAVYSADGEGHVDGAIVVRLIPGEDADALKVQVDDGPERLWARGELKPKLYGEIDAAIAAGRPRVFEVEAPPFVRALSLALLLHDLTLRGEVRLMVAKIIQPPYARLPDWALLATQPNGPDIDRSAIAHALTRAVGKRCEPELERRMAAAMKDKANPDESAIRAALPDALAACGCRGADVEATAWLYEQLMIPTHRAAWLRVKVVEGGTTIRGHKKYAGDVIHALTATPATTRDAGVWLEQPF
ncbi:MAG: hypothetical protein K8M05_29190 [Deltaproteobacteria bacterium]|nr:hypothetical protein [Kofleriaceae bacterium]